MSEHENLHARISQLVERNSRLGAELECALGDVATAKGIIERLQKDADRYRWLRDGAYADDIESTDGTPYVGSNGEGAFAYGGVRLDQLIDTDMRKAKL